MNEVQTDSPETAVSDGRSRRGLRVLGLILIIVPVLVGWYMLVTYLGIQQGEAELAEKRVTERQAIIERQTFLAGEDITANRYTLALRRLEWVLARDPQNETALTLQTEASGALSLLLTPQPINTAPAVATATPTPLPTVTAAPIDSPESELRRVQLLMANQKWDEAVSTLVAFQRQFPDYERMETDTLLYEAYIQLGLQFIEGEQVELGLFYLAQAERLGDLPQEVLDYQLWAELYLQGIAFYGANWSAATYYFRDLCLAAPFYQSACQRLQESLINYGDQFAGSFDWCPAQGLYQEALSYGRSPELVTKANQASEECLLATPTPAPGTGITNTVPITGSQDSVDEFIIPNGTTPTAVP